MRRFLDCTSQVAIFILIQSSFSTLLFAKPKKVERESAQYCETKHFVDKKTFGKGVSESFPSDEPSCWFPVVKSKWGRGTLKNSGILAAVWLARGENKLRVALAEVSRDGSFKRTSDNLEIGSLFDESSLYVDRIWIDTANYKLSKDVVAFAVRVRARADGTGASAIEERFILVTAEKQKLQAVLVRTSLTATECRPSVDESSCEDEQSSESYKLLDSQTEGHFDMEVKPSDKAAKIKKLVWSHGMYVEKK